MSELKCKNCGEPLEPGWDVCPACQTPVVEEIKCVKCGEILQPQWKMCPSCGTPVNEVLYCANCHAELKPGWKMCPECGTPVQQGTEDNKQPVKKTADPPKPNTQCPWCDAEVYAEDKSLVECPHCNNLFFEDERDGHIYQAVKIGKQIWMAENLNYKTRKDSWCNDNDPANCEKYGRLYTWEKAKMVAPKGWHLSTDEEWKQLEMELGMSRDEADRVEERGINEGEKMKSKFGWDKYGNGNNSSGFNALPGGLYDIDDEIPYFMDPGTYGYWWSGEIKSDIEIFRVLKSDNLYVDRRIHSINLCLSVRCLKD